MDLLNGIISAVSMTNLFYCFVGCLLGTLVGVLPGISPSSTIAILFPVIMFLNPTGSIIMLAGLYYGAQYGGSTTSILVNIPGEPSSVVTCLDGFQMTRQGRGGQALWIAAVSSFIAGTLGIIGITFIGAWIAKYAIKFGPPEYCGLVLFSLTTIITLSGTAVLKGITAGAKVLALSAFDLLTDPRALAEIRQEFAELKAKRPYKSFLPEGSRPPLGFYTELMGKYRPSMEKYYIDP